MKVKSLDANVVRLPFTISNVVPNDIVHTEQGNDITITYETFDDVDFDDNTQITFTINFIDKIMVNTINFSIIINNDTSNPINIQQSYNTTDTKFTGQFSMDWKSGNTYTPQSKIVYTGIVSELSNIENKVSINRYFGQIPTILRTTAVSGTSFGSLLPSGSGFGPAE